MMFYEYLKKNNNIVTCYKCKEKLYKFVGKNYKGDIKAKDFKSINKKAPHPSPETEMKCPLCKAALVYDLNKL